VAREERTRLGGLIVEVGGDQQHAQAVLAPALGERDQRGELLAARSAPRGPDV
jgi:hypothetical protein